MSVDANDRKVYIEKWAKLLKVKPNEWDIACHMINVVKNYDTAMAVCFNLSWRKDKIWLRKCSDYFQQMWKGYGPDAKADVNWLYAFTQMYIKDVAAYPTSDA
jgi:hypothetical protein